MRRKPGLLKAIPFCGAAFVGALAGGAGLAFATCFGGAGAAGLGEAMTFVAAGLLLAAFVAVVFLAAAFGVVFFFAAMA